jgi:cAMP phosphodiesterase
MQGSGGGPSEDNVTGFLVRSMASNWGKGSVLAVDAGSHLAAITRILEKDFPLVSEAPQDQASTPSPEDLPSPGGDAKSESDSTDSTCDRSMSPEAPVRTLESGPFTGLSLPHVSARANAVHVVREHVSTYLITHPHLDHLSGFAINTAAFHNTSRPKRLAALPFAVNAIKTHIFNDIIWPNLTDEDNGVGLVTFQRLTEGGNLALGDGISRGFIEVCDGLAVKGFKVSHGNCASTSQSEHQTRRNSIPQPGGNHQLSHSGHGHNHAISQHSPNEPLKIIPGDGGRRSSIFSQPSQPGTPTFYGQGQQQQEFLPSVVDSTAFFIRAEATGKEILIFGDVEPDTISSFPRTHIVWAEAAPKIAHGLLAGIFIECSYNDSQNDAVLFGHLSPRHLIAELQTLGEMVAEKKRESAEKVGRKRKRAATGLGGSTAEDSTGGTRSRSRTKRATTPKLTSPDDTPMGDVLEEPAPVTPNTATFNTKDVHTPHHHHHHHNHHHQHNDTPIQTPNHHTSLSRNPTMEAGNGTFTPTQTYEPPLKNVKIVIIHVKDSMLDGPLVGESILKELNAHEAKLTKQGKGLGCTFEVSASGDSYWF